MTEAVSTADQSLIGLMGALRAPGSIVSEASVGATASAIGSRVVPVHDFLGDLCRSLKCTFVLNGAPIEASHVMSPEMFLPVVGWTVQDAGRRLLDGANLACVLRKDEDSLFGARCLVPPVTGHIVDVVRSLFFIHYATEMFGLRESALIEVHPVYEALKSQFEELIESQSPSPEGDIQWPQFRAT